MAGSAETDGDRGLQVRGLRAVYAVVFAVGCCAVGLAAAFEDFRSPFMLFVSIVAVLLGLIGILDRRVKLSLTPAGIRYARWGPVVIPWHEFAGFQATEWKNNLYLQLIPRHTSYVLEHFSWLGRLNNRCARLIGSPPFSIAITPLAITDWQLAAAIGEHLPQLRSRP